jgi:hypothetical protein
MQGRTKAQVHVRREFVRQLAIKVKNRTKASDFLGEAFSISFDKTSANFVGSLGSLDLALLIALFRAEVVPYDNVEMGVEKK